MKFPRLLRRYLSIGMAALALTTFACSTAAQPSAQRERLQAGHAWSGTRWVVKCDGGIESLYCKDDAAAAAYYTTTLEEASIWLRDLGFRGPSVENDQGIYIARVSDVMNADAKGVRKSVGVYHPADQKLYLTTDTFFAMGEMGKTDKQRAMALGMNLEYTATVVHELFHGVQYSYPSLQPGGGSVDGWIIEGMADAVLVSWIRQEMADEPLFGKGRKFDFPLHKPRQLPKPAQNMDAYYTARFWRGIGKIIGSPNDIKYLHAVLQQDLHADHGLPGVDAGLRQFDQDGLYSLYPEFIARYVRAPQYFAEVGKIDLQYKPKHKVRKSVPGTVREVAASAHQLSINLPKGRMASLKIEFAQDHPDLHLIVDHERLDGSPLRGRKASQVAGPSKPRERNVFRSVIYGRDKIEPLFIRVVNVAPQAVDSKARSYKLIFTLDPMTPCSPEMMAAAVNNDGSIIPIKGGAAAMMSQELGFQAGQSTLRFTGLVDDEGLACASPVFSQRFASATEDQPKRAKKAPSEPDWEKVQRNADAFKTRMDKIAQELFGKSSIDDVTDQDYAALTPEQQARMAKMMGITPKVVRDFEHERSNAWREREGDVIIPIYSPNVTPHLSGMLSHPISTRHNGVGGWRPNAAALINLQLPGTSGADVKEGGTYPAEAYASDSAERIPGKVATHSAFYTRWDGKWVEDCYDLPAQMKQSGQQAAREIDPDGEWIDVDHVMERGCVKNGTAQFLTGHLTGTVTVKTITATEIQGTFSVNGPATLHVTELHATESKGERQQTGVIAIDGKFNTPTARIPIESE